jgi:hypothetical protein
MEMAMLEKIKGYIPLNFAIMGNPVNWLIVALMLAIAGVAVMAIVNPSDFLYPDNEKVVR